MLKINMAVRVLITHSVSWFMQNGKTSTSLAIATFLFDGITMAIPVFEHDIYAD